MRRSALRLAAVVAACVVSSPAQVTLTINPAADGTLYQDANGALANGSGTLLFSGLNNNSAIRRGLVRFDLTQIPAGSFVCSASLQMTAIATTNNGPATIGLHPVSTSWGEGASVAGGAQGGGGPSQPGDATWLHTAFPTAFWASAGGDFAATASGSCDVSVPGTYLWTHPGLAVDVQSWVDLPSSNFGWVLRSPETTPQSMKHFGTREQATPSNRPQLTVTYQLPATASVTPVGPGCPLPPASLLTLSTPVLPTIPSPLFGLAVTGGSPGGSASVYLSPTLAFPTALGNNCVVLLDLAGVNAFIASGASPLAPIALDGAGAGFMPIPIPSVPCLGGTQIALQALNVDPQFPGGFAVSNALALVVGH